MRIVQINLIGRYQSTGRTMLELHNYLLSKGHQSLMVYGHGSKPKDRNEYRVVGWIGYYFHNIMARLFGSQGWHSRLATKKLIRLLEKFNPDVIHLRNLHGNFLHIGLFFDFLKKYPGKVVWTTHDFWLISGGCPMLDCPKWKEQCASPCPFYLKFPLGRKSYIKRNFEVRRRFFDETRDLVLQANSRFALNILKDSIAKDVNTSVIYNWIDCASFAPCRKRETGRKPVIQIAWSLLNKEQERFKRFVSFASEYSDKYEFRMLGKIVNFQEDEYPYVSFCNPSNDKAELAGFYSDGDVFLNTSFMDTFGKVVAESLACGTPAVVFNNGALPELIGPNCGAVLSPNATNSEIDDAICGLLTKPHAFYEQHCRSFVLEKFDYETNCAQLEKLYLAKNASC